MPDFAEESDTYLEGNLLNNVIDDRAAASAEPLNFTRNEN